MIDRLKCWWYGHKRGKRIEVLDNGTTKRYQCSRCNATWTRKGKA